MTTVRELKKEKSTFNGRETKMFFPSDVNDEMTLVEYNKKFGVPDFIYADNLEQVNPFRTINKL